MLPDNANGAGCADVRVSRQERQRQRTCRGDDERIERIARESQIVGIIDLLGSEVERVIRRVAEEIAEKFRHRPPQVHAAGARQKPNFPDDRDRHIRERLLAFAGVEVLSRPAAQHTAGGCVKEQSVGIRNRGWEISHGDATALPA